MSQVVTVLRQNGKGAYSTSKSVLPATCPGHGDHIKEVPEAERKFRHKLIIESSKEQRGRSMAAFCKALGVGPYSRYNTRRIFRRPARGAVVRERHSGRSGLMMSEKNDQDGLVDALAITAIVTIVVVAVVFWLVGMPG
jgi:hypothetical protein